LGANPSSNWSLEKVFADHPDLVEKHNYYIDILSWNITTGIWVDNTLIAGIGVMGMKMALAAVIEAIFVGISETDIKIGQ
jgi:hypothetical protein